MSTTDPKHIVRRYYDEDFTGCNLAALAAAAVGGWFGYHDRGDIEQGA